jgi:hypothetical protein
MKFVKKMSHCSSVCKVTGYGMEDRGSISNKSGNSFGSRRSGWFWGPHSLLSNGYRGGSFLGGKAAGARSWQLTSIYCRGQECVELYLHFPSTPSWRGDQLKHRDNLTFTFKVLHYWINMFVLNIVSFIFINGWTLRAFRVSWYFVCLV